MTPEPDNTPPNRSALVSRSGRRRQNRVTMPVVVELDGCHYAALDWSSGGFALDGAGPAMPLGAVAPARLHFEINGERYFAAVTARVVRVTGQHAIAFEFTDENGRDAALLDDVAKLWLTGAVGGPVATMPTSAALPSPSAGVPAPRPSGGMQLALPAMATPRPITLRLGTRMRYYAGIALGGAAVAAVAAFLVASRTTVSSDYAAVSGELQVVRAPMDGLLRDSVLRPGATVRAGAVIGQLQPVVTPAALTAARTALDLAEAKVNQQRALLDSLNAGYAGFIAYAKHALAEATTARQMMSDQLAAEQRVYDRLRILAQTGAVSPLRADQELVNLRTQQHAQATAVADEAAAKQRLDDAMRGRFITDGRSTQLAPSDIARDLKVNEAQRDSAAAAVAALSVSTPLLSPCDCTVTSIVAPDQTFVQLGNPIANLAISSAKETQVDALVPSGMMSFLRPGQSVRVYLSDRADPVEGRLASLNYNPAGSGRVGLPDTLRTLNNYGVMTVALPGVEPIPVGTPAVVNATAGFGMLMRHLPGLNTLFSHGPARQG